MSAPKRVAAVVTEYRRHSHADVLLTKILEGYFLDRQAFPNMRLVSLYVDQFPDRDISRTLAQRHGFTIYPNVEDVLTLGGREVAVDGVLIIGEHGRYPTNDRGQIFYPRRRWFEAVTNVLARQRRSIPIFNDKHLAATWSDARWMYDRSLKLYLPFMAGSSLPVSWRRPALELPLYCDLVEAVQIGYGPVEGYGFHAVEGLQCMAERRRGGESGVRSVQCLMGEDMWRALDRGLWSRPVLESAMGLVSAHARGDVRAATARARDACVALIEYRDGFRAAIAMLNGWVYEGDGGAFIFAGQVRGEDQPRATLFYQQQPDPFAHFAYLLRAIDTMMETGHAVYPVERTLLTTGILDAMMISRAENGRRVATPYLDIRYQPTGWPFATDPVPPRINR